MVDNLIPMSNCYFCGLYSDDDPRGPRKLVEKHHIKERSKGGDNNHRNIIEACSNCHSKIHLGIIKLDRYYMSTKGLIFHWWDENGKERWGNELLNRL